jgi:hypothetical protein
MSTLFEIAGFLTAAVVVALAALFIFGWMSVAAFKRSGRVGWPRLTLASLKFFYSPLAAIQDRLGAPAVVDGLLVSAVNQVMAARFKDAGPRRMVFVPQCLRAPGCRARLDSRLGYICDRCGACPIAPISEGAEAKGYSVFIVPGDSFVKRIVRNERPDAVIGVACHEELSMAMLAGMRMRVICAGVMLKKSGCFNTDVDVEKVLKMMDGEECSNSSDK